MEEQIKYESPNKLFSGVTTGGEYSSMNTDVKPVSILSTENAKNRIGKMSEEMGKMTPSPKTTTTEKPTEKPTEDKKLTLLNPATGQEQTIFNPDVNIQQIQGLINSGWMNSEGYMPSGVKLKDQETTSTASTTPIKPDTTDLDIYKNKLINFDVSNDPALQSLLANITSEWDTRIKQQEQINKAREGAISTLGTRLGTSRYAPLVATGILGAEEKSSIDKISDLQNKKNMALAEAKSAYESGQWTKYAKLYEIAKDSYNKQVEEYNRLNEATIKENEKIKERENLIKIDSAVSDLIGAGLSDPNDILQTMKKYGIDATSQEVGDALKNLTVDETDAKNLPNDIESFNYLKDNGLLLDSIASLPENEQYFAYLRNIKGIEKGTGTASVPIKVGVGAKNETDEVMIRTRLFSKLMNIINKGQVSDSDRKIIDERITQFRDSGMSEQEIMDRLSGFATDITTPYNNSFRNLIVQNTTDSNTQTDMMGKVSLLLNSGDSVGAMKLVENIGLEKAKNLMGTGEGGSYMDTASANVSLARTNRIKEIFREAGILGAPGGPVAGTFQNLLGRFKGENATKLKAELTNLYASFRKEILGSAVTPSETKFLEPLLANITDKKGNFLEKLDVFEKSVLDRYNSTRRSVNLPSVRVSMVS